MNVTKKILEARNAIWNECPKEIPVILARRDINHPIGNLLYAEGCVREFAELIFTFREAIDQGTIDLDGAHELLPVFFKQLEVDLAGMYMFRDGGALITELMAEIPTASKEEIIDAMDELRVYMSRLCLWLDSYLPWQTINEQIRKGLVP